MTVRSSVEARLEQARIAALPRRYAAWLWLERHVLGVCSLHATQPKAWCKRINHPKVWR